MNGPSTAEKIKEEQPSWYTLLLSQYNQIRRAGQFSLPEEQFQEMNIRRSFPIIGKKR
jgi:hypothetical protein